VVFPPRRYDTLHVVSTLPLNIQEMFSLPPAVSRSSIELSMTHSMDAVSNSFYEHDESSINSQSLDGASVSALDEDIVENQPLIVRNRDFVVSHNPNLNSQNIEQIRNIAETYRHKKQQASNGIGSIEGESSSSFDDAATTTTSVMTSKIRSDTIISEVSLTETEIRDKTAYISQNDALDVKKWIMRLKKSNPLIRHHSNRATEEELIDSDGEDGEIQWGPFRNERENKLAEREKLKKEKDDEGRK
jgi:hypothetical protein